MVILTVFLDAISKKNENMNVEETQIKMVRYFAEHDFLAFNICRCMWLILMIYRAEGCCVIFDHHFCHGTRGRVSGSVENGFGRGGSFNW